MQTGGKFVRQMGTFSLTLSGISCIIGSGWLFGAYHASKLAGPAAIFAWLIGGFAVLLIALTIAELGALFPKSGGMARYMEYSHGSLAGFTCAWANWLSVVTVIPAEAEASVQYLSSWKWPWAQGLFDAASGTMTHSGLVLAGVLLIVYFFLNYWALNLFVRSMVALTIFKIVVPVLTVVMIIRSGFHAENFTVVGNTIAPYGWSAVLTAVSTCGIIFSFNGFQTPANLAGEAKNPHISIPLSVTLSIVVCLALYLLLQVAFIGGLSTDVLAAHGWHGIEFSSPFAQLALALQLNFVMVLLYVDAFISPSGTGVSYLAATARLLYGMQRNGYMPAFMGRLHPKYLIPRGAVWFNLIMSFVFLSMFRGWGHLAAVVSVVTVISYLTGPIAVMGLRRVAPDLKRPLKIGILPIVAPISFVVISLVFYWSCWPLTGQFIAVILLGLVIYAYYQRKQGWPNFKAQLKGGVWLLCYMPSMALLSYLGSHSFGGIDLLQGGWDQLAVAVTALIYYQWGVRSAWVTPQLQSLGVTTTESLAQTPAEEEPASAMV